VKIKYSIVYTSSLIILFGLSSLKAQDNQDTPAPEATDDQGDYLDIKSGWFFGADAGTTLFYGDVTTFNVFPKFKDFNESFGSGVSIFGGKKIKWGLSGEIQLNSGKLEGIKMSIINNPFFFNTQYQSYSISAKYNISDFYSRKAGARGEGGRVINRMNIYITAGIGQVFYRSRLNYANDNRIKDYYGYKTTSASQLTGQQFLEKDKSLRTLIVPIGAKFQYKMNYKTEIVFDFYYVNSSSDKLDAWERSWTQNDRYMYMGAGLVLHFGKSESEDIPEKLRFKKNSSSSDDVPEEENKKGVFKSKSKRRSSSSDEDLNLRLKLFETQLKLFEMQHLMDEKK
jgi:hypothetical protein